MSKKSDCCYDNHIKLGQIFYEYHNNYSEGLLILSAGYMKSYKYEIDMIFQ